MPTPGLIHRTEDPFYVTHIDWEAAARVQIQDLGFTAKTAGAAGDSIRVKYEYGSPLAVSVATNDITVTIVAATPLVPAVASEVVYDTVTFTAVTPGIAGDSIALVFNGTTDDLDTIVNAWNLANPANTVGFAGQIGTYIPTAGTATLINGADAVPAVNGSTAEEIKDLVNVDVDASALVTAEVIVVGTENDVQTAVAFTSLTGGTTGYFRYWNVTNENWWGNEPYLVSGVHEGISGNQLGMYGNCSAITGDVTNTYGNVGNIRGPVTNIRGIVSDLSGYVGNINGTVTNLSGDVSGLVGTVTNLIGDATDITGTVSSLTGNITPITGNCSNISGAVSTAVSPATVPATYTRQISGDVSNISGSVAKIYGDVSNISGSVARLTGDVSNLIGNVGGLKGVIVTNQDFSTHVPPVVNVSLTGNVSNLSGDVTGIYGVCDIMTYGNLDNCGILAADRIKGVDIATLQFVP